MASLRDVRRRIKSVQNTQKITKAQQVVAATKIRRAQQMVQATRPYAEKMLEVLQTTTERAREYRHPFLEDRERSRALLILVTSDRGLAGALNVNSLRAANRYLNQNYPRNARVITIGRKGRELMNRLGREIVAEVSNLPDRPGLNDIIPATRAAIDELMEGRSDVLLLAYAQWISTMRQEPLVKVLVPAEIPKREEGQGPGADYEYEPGPESVLDALLPRYIETQVYQAVLENKASEWSARMIAMKNATDNAGELVQELTLSANKMRQASITTELMEIVSGAEALRAS